MSKIYYKLFYHIVWSTHLHYPEITEEVEKYLYPFLENKSKRFGCSLIAVGGTQDHIHLAIIIPPSESVADIIGKLKGSSTYFLNKELNITKDFSWQTGYGVLSFAEKDLGRIVGYINNQKLHHLENKLNSKMEITEED